MTAVTDVLSGKAQRRPLALHYREVPVSAVRERLPALREALDVEDSSAMAAEDACEDGTVTILHFSASMTELEQFADRLRMQRDPRSNHTYAALIEHRLGEYSLHAPDWFRKHQEGVLVAFGAAYGDTYWLEFLATEEADQGVTVFALVISWPDSLSDHSKIPSWWFAYEEH
jgi:hypothetical protein